MRIDHAHVLASGASLKMARSRSQTGDTIPSPRRATDVTLPDSLLRDAREFGINVLQACEVGLTACVAEARRRRWLTENREAMDAWNDHVAAHGLPLAAYRQF